jgi:hypothetical protein
MAKRKSTKGQTTIYKDQKHILEKGKRLKVSIKTCIAKINN